MILIHNIINFKKKYQTHSILDLLTIDVFQVKQPSLAELLVRRLSMMMVHTY